MPFPSPPWRLEAQLWLSLFAVRSSGRADRPGGVYVAAFVDYQEGGVLCYREVLVARLVRRGPVPQVRITDIWVDSEASREGGRSLWAMPKELATISVEDDRGTALSRTSCAAGSIASARFTATPAALRTPFAAELSQPRDDGSSVETRLSGSARALPCKASWTFDADGPLAWMHGRRSLGSFRLSDLHLTFGG